MPPVAYQYFDTTLDDMHHLASIYQCFLQNLMGIGEEEPKLYIK